VAEPVRDVYTNSLLFGEHTWGGSMAWLDFRLSYGDQFRKECASGRFARTEESWDEHAAYAQAAVDGSRRLLQDGLDALARSVALAGPRVVVYNPLPWPRDGEVDVAWPGSPSAWVSAADGESVPARAEGDRLRFVAHDVPANGYLTYAPAGRGAERRSEVRADPRRGVVESRYFRAVLDPDRGAIGSLVDKRTGRELVDRSSPYALGQSLYERFDRSQVDAYLAAYTVGGGGGALDFGKPCLPAPEEGPYEARTVRHSEVSTALYGDRVEATLRSPIGDELPYGVTLRVSLPADRPEVRLEVAIEGKPLEPWPEAGWMCLPLRIRQPSYLLGRVGSLTDPARDLVRGANHHLFWLNTGLAVTDPSGTGVGVCPLDHPLVALGEPGCWRYDREYVPTKPTVFVNLFNNQWSTDFRLWVGGSWSSRVTLWSIDALSPERGLITPALDARYPLLAAASDGPGGDDPPRRAGLALSRGGVQVTAFGPNPDGPGLILRLWELSGQGGPCVVRLPEGIGPGSVQPVDLRGRPLGRPIAVRNGRFRVALHPFGPVSLAIGM
jgi:alpha-mannosidase